MSQRNSPLVGVDSQGNHVPLVASINHPDKNVILIRWREGYDATTFTLGGHTVIAIGDGFETYTFKVALKQGEEIVGIARDSGERLMKVVTRDVG